MSGRSTSLAIATFAGIRVSSDNRNQGMSAITYIPAHNKGGKLINQRAIISIYRNSHRGTDQRTGQPGRTDSFSLVAWGKLADTCCRSLSPGKAIDVICEPHSYIGKSYNQDGSIRIDAAGQEQQQKKVAFTIQQIVFGEEAEKAVQNEIASGRRPVNWNVPNHPDWQLWKQILGQRQATVWDGQSQAFGFARVVIPQGQGIQVDLTACVPGGAAGRANNGNVGNAGTGGFTQPGNTANAGGFQNTMANVANGMNPNMGVTPNMSVNPNVGFNNGGVNPNQFNNGGFTNGSVPMNGGVNPNQFNNNTGF